MPVPKALRPQTHYLFSVGSYSRGGKTEDAPGRDDPQSQSRGPGAGVLNGMLDQAVFTALDRLTDTIAQKHRESGFQ